MTTGTASADPAKLEAAAQAVPEELRVALARASGGLRDKIDLFNRSLQRPERVTVSAELHAGSMDRAVARGNELDTHLLRVAGAFRAAGSDRPPGFVGPVHGVIRFMDDAALAAEMDRWGDPQALEFRRRDDGTYEVRGPDGHWYVMRDAPPLGATPLDRTQQVVDLGNPDFGFVLSAAILVGLTGGSTQPLSRSAPPEAYEYIHLDPNGYPVAGPEVTGHGLPPYSPPPGDAAAPASPRAAGADALTLVIGGMSEASKHMNAKHQNVYRTQARFFVDPHSGERVAVIDAASIRYDNGTNDAVVTSGRLSTNDDGEPILIPRPPEYDLDDPSCVTPGDDAGPATEIRIPAKDD